MVKTEELLSIHGIWCLTETGPRTQGALSILTPSHLQAPAGQQASRETLRIFPFQSDPITLLGITALLRSDLHYAGQVCSWDLIYSTSSFHRKRSENRGSAFREGVVPRATQLLHGRDGI